jgi:pyridoxal phosphate enzyme (YggS family)
MDQQLLQLEINTRDFLKSIPSHVQVVAAAKTRTIEEVQAVIKAGIAIIGHNYVKEAVNMVPEIEAKTSWHLIGHLQRNKVNKAVELFDLIETVDSFRLAKAIDQACTRIGKVMPIFIEINSGEESNKSGVLPGSVLQLIHQISPLQNIRVKGLMTMGPLSGYAEDSRPYFKLTKHLFDQIGHEKIENVEMRYLSMGMSDSYQIAIEEGANLVRIGTKLFGPRVYL